MTPEERDYVQRVRKSIETGEPRERTLGYLNTLLEMSDT